MARPTWRGPTNYGTDDSAHRLSHSRGDIVFRRRPSGTADLPCSSGSLECRGSRLCNSSHAPVHPPTRCAAMGTQVVAPSSQAPHLDSSSVARSRRANGPRTSGRTVTVQRCPCTTTTPHGQTPRSFGRFQGLPHGIRWNRSFLTPVRRHRRPTRVGRGGPGGVAPNGGRDLGFQMLSVILGPLAPLHTVRGCFGHDRRFAGSSLDGCNGWAIYLLESIGSRRALRADRRRR